MKINKGKGHSYRTFWLVHLLLLSIIGYFFTENGVTDDMANLVSLFVTIAGTICVFTLLGISERDKLASFILFCGYLIRVYFCSASKLGLPVLEVSSAPSDTENFWQASFSLYYGIPIDIILTKYPYILRWFYKLFGCNRYVAEYVNVLFWALSSVILVKLSKHVKLSGVRKYILYGLWAILPANMIFSVELLRESIMVFFDMWSFYIFLKWMESGKKNLFVLACILVVPAAYLHTASIALWAAYIAIAAFWDYRKRKFYFMKKTVEVLVVGVLVAGLILFSPLRSVFGAYIGTDISIYAITHRAYMVGGSDYLQWMDCQGWVQFIFFTILRMLYFLFSPMPWEARGLIDLFSFVFDGLLVLCLMVYMKKRMKDRDKRAYIFASFFCILALSGIFAWGVRNAGTAIRHRMLVWGVLIMGSCIAFGASSLEKDESTGKVLG